MSPFKTPLAFLACALGVTLAACGSSGGSSPASSAPASSPASSTAAGSSSGAAIAITANWEAFFSAKTPVTKRISLLQDGPQFATVIKSQAGTGLAAEATAKVAKVTVTSPTQATVAYSILIAGSPALPGQSGVAVLQGGTWKVGVASFCGLLTLENGGKTAGLPSACQTAG
jgi:hypothetical protein